MHTTLLHRLALLAVIGLLCGCLVDSSASNEQDNPPNIVFFILDDVGIDQMRLFGYGGINPPHLPNITAIANAGVSFRNMWVMPDYSPSRALVFDRYPLRNKMLDAILSVRLPNTHISRYESTTPRILRERGYSSALFGKLYLPGSGISQSGDITAPPNITAAHQLGWDFFKGWQEESPLPIDTTAGGVAAPGTSYTCGFIPGGEAPRGAGVGACYFANNTCAAITDTPTPGRSCLERGGIFVPGRMCSKEAPPANLDFTRQNGYYVGQLVVNRADGSAEVYPPQHPSGAARGYRTILESDWAIDWINHQPSDMPWMATVSFTSAQTPFQQAPTSLLRPDSIPAAGLDCTDMDDQRVISNQMIEGIDSQIGRVLVESGIATITKGVLEFTPEHANTMIVLLGDNGSSAPVVKPPFDPARARGTVYQAGVWTPLIVAGPLVREPGRTVTALVNIADVFQLFAEIAGIDIHEVVPASLQLDSFRMLPYLENPTQEPIRRLNFAQTASNFKSAGDQLQPCALATGDGGGACLQSFPSQTRCNAEGGIWWGKPDGSDPSRVGAGAPQTDCCGVNRYLLENGQRAYSVLPDAQMAIRDQNYKLVKVTNTDWDPASGICRTTSEMEFYRVDEKIPPRLDDRGSDMLSSGRQLNPAEQEALQSLNFALADILDSHTPCTGEDKSFGVIDELDIEQLKYWEDLPGFSSWFDFDLNGVTTDADLKYIASQKLPVDCG